MAAVAGARRGKLPSPADLEEIKSDLGLDLKKMSRSDLQKLAKKLHIAANGRSEDIIEQIAQQRLAHAQELFNEAEGLVCMHLAAMKTLATKAASAVALGSVRFSRRNLYEHVRTALLKATLQVF